MKIAAKVLGTGLFAMAMAVTIGNAAVGDAVSQVVTTKAEYRAGSPEVQSIQWWLRKNAALANGEMVGDPARLDDVQVTHTKAATGTGQAVGDGLPVPLPATGSSGDVISVSSVSGPHQIWTYRWEGNSSGGQWVLVKYSYERVTSSSPET